MASAASPGHTSPALEARLLEQLEQIALIDPHSHINPHAPASTSLTDLLGYHYYTELAHSAGLARGYLEDPAIDARTRAGRIVEAFEHLDHTIQVSWLIELSQRFFDFPHDRITSENWELLFDLAGTRLAQPDWEDQVLQKSGLERVFLTNDFDDPLTGFDRQRYIPCLRTDELVFSLARDSVRERLARSVGQDIATERDLQEAIGALFERFVRGGAKACAISLPPSFRPLPIDRQSAAAAVQRVLTAESPAAEDQTVTSQFVFWSLAEACAEHRLPFDLMIGVNRRVYPAGVFQGQDLFDQRVSLIDYAPLFNAFPGVVFPLSVLAQTSNHELVSYAWIFPNVVTNGHWWYSNIPACIESDLRARLQAVPRNKQIGYYSDMYKLEFGWPKFQMYRRLLARVLASELVIGQRWSEERAVSLGRQLLRGNVEQIFGV